MARELINIKDGTLEPVTEKCAYLYTKESFLYQKLNELMRFDGDREKSKILWAKVNTLGPFALLLSEIPEHGMLKGAREQGFVVEKSKQEGKEQQLSEEKSKEKKNPDAKISLQPAITETVVDGAATMAKDDS
ncbi:unnamed protein product [Rotaria sordida]|uniref:Uncharacterized protein n=1 Tax=Rotaria sordida TaxID=392033 RepID=A0A818T2B1_9BILA|nr:unnamed protein product [Rotaria sordida]CAF3681044.1 unnamed protein product [Rotaria sordida]